VLGAWAVIHILLSLWLIPQYSLAGAAIATAVAMSGWNLTLAWLVRRELGINSTIAGVALLWQKLAPRTTT
jgi:hypothetical protein